MVQLIISASRRTDIPAFYSDWFFNRIADGYVLVRNPMNLHQIGRVSLSPEVVDCIVFWTKNPERMIPGLDLLKEYMYYFHFTLNPYDSTVEKNVPNKETLIDIFIRLSEKLGENRVIWRYDPIIISHEFGLEYHLEHFDYLASRLNKHTKKCIISFVDFYARAKKKLNAMDAKELRNIEIKSIASKLSSIARGYSLKLETCAEVIDLEEYEIGYSRCIDSELIGELLGTKIDVAKDKNQRAACGCATSIDIGVYNSCSHNCAYCYANYNKGLMKKNIDAYDVNSPLLCSKVGPEDKIYERKIQSYVIRQLDMFKL